MSQFETKNIEVRLKLNPGAEGRTTGNKRGDQIEVDMNGKGLKWYPESQLELIPSQKRPWDDIEANRFSGPDKLRTSLIHMRLTGSLIDMIYSMEATNTEFHPYQFKPVVKMINSPSGSLLIADEVGLGKTIEAGLIWTELCARYDSKNLIVLCPTSLIHKWKDELEEKFNLAATIVKADDLLEIISSVSKLSRGGVYICARDSIRPDRGWDGDEYDSRRVKQQKLALKLDEISEGEPVFDLLIVDEAHHLRNPQTQSHKIAELLRSVSQHAVFLSATPIHLRNRDLYAQLKLLDPGAFTNQADFESLLEANNPIVAASEKILRAGNAEGAKELISIALKNPLLQDSEGLKNILVRLEEVITKGHFDRELRAEFAAKLDTVNLLANLVTRTRRRDVKELAIIRRVETVRAQMSEQERGFYDAVGQAVTAYALEKEINHRFLLASPQRMMTSCMSAALSHWRASGSTEIDEAPDTVSETSPEIQERPLVEFMRRNTLDWNPEELRKCDSKYKALIRTITEIKSTSKDEKIILFSAFIPTLDYLQERLAQDGFNPIVIHGKVKDRKACLDQFREDKNIDILLASEIGSEGLDLQFCKILFNYDLPWNPMKIEQRIGRVDRFGQTSPFVEIRNFIHENTIDERIWDRLYDRLKLCEQALGGFEDILGELITPLQTSLLENITPEEQGRRIEQAAQAAEQKKKEHEALEKDAAGLIAHGDYILNKVRAAYELNRWLTPLDLQKYIISFFAQFYPQSKLTINANDPSLCSIRLEQRLKEDLRKFCQGIRVSLTTNLYNESSAEVLFGRTSAGHQKKFELINHQHPLIRFAAENISKNRATSPAISATITRNHILPKFKDRPCQIEPGYFVLAVQLWSLEGDITHIEKMVFGGWDVDKNKALSHEDAEILAVCLLSNGERLGLNCDKARLEKFSAISQSLFEKLTEDKSDFCLENQLELNDRAAFQLRSLDKHQSNQEHIINDVLNRHWEVFNTSKNEKEKTRRKSLIEAQKGKLRVLRERMKDKRRRIENSKEFTSEGSDVSAIIVKVTP